MEMMKIDNAFLFNENLSANHKLVYIALAYLTVAKKVPTVQKISQLSGLTEKSATKQLRELEDRGYITITKFGKSNIYSFHHELLIEEVI